MDEEYEPLPYQPAPPRAPLGTLYGLGLVTGVLITLLVLRTWPKDRDLQHYEEVRDFVRANFVRGIDDEELLDHALHGMLSALDPYSRYYDALEREELDRETYGRYVGVGVVFRPPVERGQILFALPDSPAARAGLRVGDTIVGIDGRSVREMGEAALRAELGQDERILSLDVLGLDGSERQLQLRPSQVVDPTVRHVRMIDSQVGIGYLSLSSFSRQTSAEFDRAFEFLRRRGMKALILDLRYNFGGVLDAAQNIARRFIPEGVIVSTDGRGEPEVTLADGRYARYVDFPVVVLVDGDSASASEVLAGALQDHRRGALVGSPTYGKGLVQTIRRFETIRSVAKVTSSYYYSPAGRNFERTAQEGRDYGLLPDVDIPIDETTERAIHTYLRRYGPPVEALIPLERWQDQEADQLLEPHPEDPQLRAAIQLLRGQRPGPQDSSSLRLSEAR